MSYIVQQSWETIPDKVRKKAEEKGYSIPTHKTMVVDDEEGLSRMTAYLSRAQSQGRDIGFDIETTSKIPIFADLVGLAFAADYDKGFYVPVGHVTGEQQLPVEVVLAEITEIVGGPGITMANGKFDWHVMLRNGVEVRYGKDSQVYSRLMGDIEYGVGLKPTMERLFKEANVEFTDLVTKKTPHLGHIEIGEVAKYAGADAINVLRVVHEIEPRLPDEIRKLLLKVEHEVLRIAGDMEYHGAPVDEEFVRRHIEAGEAMVERLKTEAIQKLKAVAKKRGADPDLVPDNLNLDSAPQMQKVLFDVCGFPVIKRSKKTKKPSADKAVIAKMAETYKEVEWVSRYRSASTRVGDLKEFITYGHQVQINDQGDYWWFVHGGLHPQRAATGRWGSSNPNLQNMTKVDSVYESERSRWQVKLRDAIQTPPGFYIVTADYSQIELRVAAGESQCRAWMQAFTDGVDVHVATAAAALRIAPEAVDAKQRHRGKTLNFSMLFGATEDNISGQLGITKPAAGELVASFWSGLPEVRAWRDRVHAQARAEGYSSTHFGRRRYFDVFTNPPSDDRRRKWMMLEAYRESLNTVVQGTAADILKIALLRAEKTWKEFDAGLWLTIHDQFVWMVPDYVNPREFCQAIDERISFPIEGYPEIVSDFSIGRRFGTLIDFDSAAAVPETWEEVFADREDGFTVSETGERVRELIIEVDKMGDPASLMTLITENPGANQVRVMAQRPELNMVLPHTTSLTEEDGMQIAAALAGARVRMA